mmetsp:Transcript_14636/g.13145  ORF Transcript_14636/g.13145 Transcript_14636/m.13145 type:complete len:114 (-) Transcript_14636:108-449(-)
MKEDIEETDSSSNEPIVNLNLNKSRGCKDDLKDDDKDKPKQKDGKPDDKDYDDDQAAFDTFQDDVSMDHKDKNKMDNNNNGGYCNFAYSESDNNNNNGYRDDDNEYTAVPEHD